LRALGNPTEIERQAAVIAAAELQVLAEEARAAALKQGGGDLDQVIRVQAPPIALFADSVSNPARFPFPRSLSTSPNGPWSAPVSSRPQRDDTGACRYDL